MNDNRKNHVSPSMERGVTTEVIGKAIYSAHKRDYARDVSTIYEAYLDALTKAHKWVDGIEREKKNSAKVYGMHYKKPATASHISLKGNMIEYIFRQKIKVHVIEVAHIDNLSPEDIAIWKLRDRKSHLADPENMNVSHSHVAHMPLTAYKVIEADGMNWQDTFGNLVKKLNEIKNVNHYYDPASEESHIKPLSDSCDSFDLLYGNKNHIEAGVTMRIPYIYEFERPHLVEIHEVPESELTASGILLPY